MKYVIGIEEGRNEPIKDLDNAERVVLVDKAVGSEDITFAYCRFEAETSSHKKHIHKNAEEIIYILSGKGISRVDDTEIEMTKRRYDVCSSWRGSLVLQSLSRTC